VSLEDFTGFEIGDADTDLHLLGFIGGSADAEVAQLDLSMERVKLDLSVKYRELRLQCISKEIERAPQRKLQGRVTGN
jgi:hypothetical protein